MDNTLRLTSPHDSPLVALFHPEQGMELSSFSLNGRELISKGRANLIGPHYGDQPQHLRAPNNLKHGVASHGPWKLIYCDESSCVAEMNGKSLWQERPLSFYQGQDFKMTFKATLNAESLLLTLAIVSDADSLVGLDYRWLVPVTGAKVSIPSTFSHLLPNAVIQGELAEVPLDDTGWAIGSTPFPDPLRGMFQLTTEDYKIQMDYYCVCQENWWHIEYLPNEAELSLLAASAQDPLHPNLSVSSLQIAISVKEMYSNKLNNCTHLKGH